MRHIFHAAFSVVRHNRGPSSVAALASAPMLPLVSGRTTLARPLHASFPRTLSLASLEPITISGDRQSITIRLSDGRSITQKISPTPKVKLEKLAGALASLLSAPESNPSTSGLSFGTLQWELDPLGDAIHRHIALASPEEGEKVEQLIMAEAEAINHHPHLVRGSGNTNEESCMTITCTTHSPRGLSARDTRLAMKINELLASFNVVQPVEPAGSTDNLEELEKQVREQQERFLSISRQQIAEALESCACGSAKS